MDAILNEAHVTLQYRRQYRNKGYDIHSSIVFVSETLLPFVIYFDFIMDFKFIHLYMALSSLFISV